jgi:transcriptional regulator with XRE-family HTH domain
MDPDFRDGGQQARTAEEQALLVALGAHLKAARRRRGWSLTTVARLSDGRFKPSAVANYERGIRAITAARLVALAYLYGTSAAELLAEATERPGVIDLTGEGTTGQRPSRRGRPLVIDLGALAAAEKTSEVEIVSDYVRALRRARVDDGSVCSLRADDVVCLARALGATPTAVRAALCAAVIQPG